jgi:hypothetical protein
MAFAAALSLTHRLQQRRKSGTEKRNWLQKTLEEANNPVETTGLINFLIEHRSESDGVNFKSSLQQQLQSLPSGQEGLLKLGIYAR